MLATRIGRARKRRICRAALDWSMEQMFDWSMEQMFDWSMEQMFVGSKRVCEFYACRLSKRFGVAPS